MELSSNSTRLVRAHLGPTQFRASAFRGSLSNHMNCFRAPQPVRLHLRITFQRCSASGAPRISTAGSFFFARIVSCAPKYSTSGSLFKDELFEALGIFPLEECFSQNLHMNCAWRAVIFGFPFQDRFSLSQRWIFTGFQAHGVFPLQGRFFLL